MSVPGESLLNIGLSFDGFGQLVKVQQAFDKTGQIVNGTIENFKQYQVEFGKMAAKVAAIFNSPGKIAGGADKVIDVFRNLCNRTSNDIKSLGDSFKKIFPQMDELMLPVLERMQGGLKKISEKLKSVQYGIQAFADLGKAGIHVADSFKKVQSTVPAALKMFQDPKQIFNPDQWSMAIFPAIDAIGQLKDNSLKFLEAISNIPGIDKFTAKIGSLASKIFPSLISGLISVTTTVWSFTAALLANPITWIVVGVIALGAAIFLLWKNWDKVVAWFQKGFQWLKDTLFKAPNWVIGLIAAFLPLIGIPLLIIKNWGTIVNFLKSVGNAIGSFFSSLWEKIVKIFAPIGNFIGPIVSSLWNKLVQLFSNVFSLVGSILSKVLLLPVRIVAVIGVILISLLSKAFEKTGSILGSVWGKVVNVFNRIAGAIGSVISSAWGQVMNIFNRVISVIGTVLGSVFTSVVGFIGPVLSWIWDQVINVFTGIGNAIGALFSSLWNTVVNFIINSVNFIGSMIGGILDFFNGIVDSVESAFNSVWSGIESVFQSIGKMFENIIPDWAKGLFDWAINPGGNSPGKNSPNPANVDQKINPNSADHRQAANQLNQSQNNRTSNTKNTKVDKIEINLTGGKNDHQTAKVIRNELLNIFGEQSAATVGG